MEKWGKQNSQKSDVEISQEGLEKAIENGRDDYERRLFDLKVVIFSHIVAGVISGPREHMPPYQISKKRLFEMLNTRTYRQMFQRSVKKCATDEVPSDFMRKLYLEFLEWQAKGGDHNAHNSSKPFDNRYELGEYKEERWMKKILNDQTR